MERGRPKVIRVGVRFAAPVKTPPTPSMLSMPSTPSAFSTPNNNQSISKTKTKRAHSLIGHLIDPIAIPIPIPISTSPLIVPLANKFGNKFADENDNGNESNQNQIQTFENDKENNLKAQKKETNETHETHKIQERPEKQTLSFKMLLLMKKLVEENSAMKPSAPARDPIEQSTINSFLHKERGVKAALANGTMSQAEADKEMAELTAWRDRKLSGTRDAQKRFEEDLAKQAKKRALHPLAIAKVEKMGGFYNHPLVRPPSAVKAIVTTALAAEDSKGKGTGRGGSRNADCDCDSASVSVSASASAAASAAASASASASISAPAPAPVPASSDSGGNATDEGGDTFSLYSVSDRGFFEWARRLPTCTSVRTTASASTSFTSFDCDKNWRHGDTKRDEGGDETDKKDEKDETKLSKDERLARLLVKEKLAALLQADLDQARLRRENEDRRDRATMQYRRNTAGYFQEALKVDEDTQFMKRAPKRKRETITSKQATS